MTARLAQLFPLVVVVAGLLVAFLAIRLDRRLSRGAHSAGPLHTERPTPPGQEHTPWELQAIDDQLVLASGGGGAAVPRYDLTATVNRLISASGLPPRSQLPISANLNELAAAITDIEDRLGLPPLAPNSNPSPNSDQRRDRPVEGRSAR